jgi:hypothetical protein
MTLLEGLAELMLRMKLQGTQHQEWELAPYVPLHVDDHLMHPLWRMIFCSEGIDATHFEPQQEM